MWWNMECESANINHMLIGTSSFLVRSRMFVTFILASTLVSLPSFKDLKLPLLLLFAKAFILSSEINYVACFSVHISMNLLNVTLSIKYMLLICSNLCYSVINEYVLLVCCPFQNSDGFPVFSLSWFIS